MSSLVGSFSWNERDDIDTLCESFACELDNRRSAVRHSGIFVVFAIQLNLAICAANRISNVFINSDAPQRRLHSALNWAYVSLTTVKGSLSYIAFSNELTTFSPTRSWFEFPKFRPLALLKRCAFKHTACNATDILLLFVVGRALINCFQSKKSFSSYYLLIFDIAISIVTAI